MVLLPFFSIEVVLAVLTQWHLSIGDKDEHYMWNVTLPGMVVKSFIINIKRKLITFGFSDPDPYL